MKHAAAPDQDVQGLDRDLHRLRNGIAWTVALLLLLLAVGLAVPDLRGVLKRAAGAHVGWLVAAVALELLSCLGYVATVRLVLRRGPVSEVRWLAWAEMAFGAVVPVGGAGGLAVGAWAMRAWGIAWSRIANRSAVIFLLTSAINAAVLSAAGFGLALGIGNGGKGALSGLLPGAIGLLGIIVFAALPVVMARLGDRQNVGRVRAALTRMAGWVRDTEAIAWERDWRLLGSAGYLLFDIAVLWACLRAVGLHPPVMAMVVGYQIGYLANLVPIPGGVGVLEGGLLGALLLYGLPAGPTAAAVVIYHAIALWVPAIGGTIGFARLRSTVGVVAAAVEARAAAAVDARAAAAQARVSAEQPLAGAASVPAVDAAELAA
ncbi:MAG TPA: lysylphosphatidylglycerol synthase transmembrane domain-containing protein [Solirubrobacteraceae bacterium]